MTVKFNRDEKDTAHRQTRLQHPTLVGAGTRRKRTAGGTDVLLRDVLINVSLETLIRVGGVARSALVSPDRMQHDLRQYNPRSMLTQYRCSETLYTISFEHCSKVCSLFKGIVYRESQRREREL